MDLWPLYHSIRVVEGGAGRPPIDPAILYSAAAVCHLGGGRQCVDAGAAVPAAWCLPLAVRWRVGELPYLGGLSGGPWGSSPWGVATLLSEGLVSMKRVAQDGVRIRASVGAASFRRQPSLEGCLEEARAQVKTLRQELQDAPAASAQREQSTPPPGRPVSCYSQSRMIAGPDSDASVSAPPSSPLLGPGGSNLHPRRRTRWKCPAILTPSVPPPLERHSGKSSRQNKYRWHHDGASEEDGGPGAVRAATARDSPSMILHGKTETHQQETKTCEQ
jgi:hypothetical protein